MKSNKTSNKTIQNNVTNFNFRSDAEVNRRIHIDEISKLMPLKDKITHAESKIEEFLIWCEKELYLNEKNNLNKEVLISFSGGKDSTVLFDLVVKVHKKINSNLYIVPAYAIEITFPETIKFIKKVVSKYQENYPFIKDPFFVKPKKAWVDILNTKGYPIFSKQISVSINRLKRLNQKTGLAKWAFGIEDSARFKLSKNRLFLLDDDMTFFIDENNKKIKYDFSEKCCDYVKGGLKHEKRPSFVGTMANESLLRKKSWIKTGCNVFNKHHPMSKPLSLWNSKDVWSYIKNYDLNVNPAYDYNKENHNIDDLRFSRLGCTACPLGSSIEEIAHRKILLKNNQDINEMSDRKYWNRFEKLYEYNQSLYISQVNKTNIRYILMDMDIRIRNDREYMELYSLRRKEIEKWYSNFKKNFLKVLINLEFYKNRKVDWFYSNDEINKALDHYGESLLTNKDIEFINKLRKKLNKKELITNNN